MLFSNSASFLAFSFCTVLQFSATLFWVSDLSSQRVVDYQFIKVLVKAIVQREVDSVFCHGCWKVEDSHFWLLLGCWVTLNNAFAFSCLYIPFFGLMIINLVCKGFWGLISGKLPNRDVFFSFHWQIGFKFQTDQSVEIPVQSFLSFKSSQVDWSYILGAAKWKSSEHPDCELADSWLHLPFILISPVFSSLDC